ncbi:type II toxin-antitoxin system HicA family toxin [Candidatus Peregrinibacteria bacterium]|nr:type II toxin-antitoxin system HicA family toxin [Candidatus Peregrinibacteria bacterium]
MPNIEKTVHKFLTRPKTLRYVEIKKVLGFLGFDLIPAKGSHKKFKHPSLKHDLVIPVHNKDCKNFYKIQASKIVKEYIL